MATEQKSYKFYNYFAFVAGLIFLLSLLGIAVFVKCPGQTPLLYQIGNVMLPLGAGLIGSSIPGMVDVSLERVGIKAGGGAALALIFFFWNPVSDDLKKNDPSCLPPTKVTRTANVRMDGILQEGVFVRIPELKIEKLRTDANGNISFEIENNNIPERLSFSFQYTPGDVDKEFRDSTFFVHDSTYKNLEFYLVTRDKPKVVAGVVLDNNTREPIEGAVVSIEGFQNIISSHTGAYSFSIVTNKQSITITAEKNNRKKSVTTVVPNPNKTIYL